MQKGLNVLVSDYIFLDNFDDFSFKLQVFGPGFAFRRRFRWYEDNIFKLTRPPYSQPFIFDSLVIDDYHINASIALQLDNYRKRFEADLLNSLRRKPGF